MAAILINVAGSYDDKAISQAQKALGKLGATAKKESGAFSGAMGRMSGAMKGLVAGLGVGLVVNGLGKVARAAQESNAVSAITTQALKTTGASAWTTAGQIDALAQSISNKTGIDDEAIQHASNLLLTFKNVKNAGEGQAAMFDRATTAAADLSAAGFGSLDSSAKMLGKALNDPVKGISALSRAGVTFTDQQKAQIKTLVDSGKTLEAQQMIMQEVESQVGGAAEAAADPIGMLKTQLGNLAEAAGKGLLPAIKNIATSLAPVFQSLQPVLTQLGGALGQVISQIVTALQPALPPIIEVATILAETLGGALGAVLPPLAAAIGDVAVAIAPLVAKAGKFVQVLVEALMPAIQPLLDALGPVIDALVIGLSPILDIVISLVQTLAPYIALVGQTFGQLLQAVAPLLPVIGMLIGVALTPLMTLLETLMPIITNVAGAFAGFATGFIANVVNVIAGALKTLGSGLAGFFSNVLGKIPFIGDKFRAAGDAIDGFVSNLSGMASGAGSSLTEMSKAAGGTAIVAGRTLGDSLMKGMGEGVDAGSRTVAKNVENGLKKAVEAGKAALDKFKEKAEAFFDFRNQIAASIRDSAKLSVDTAGIVGPSAGGIIGNLQAKLAQIRTFSKQLEDLRSLGLGNYALQQIISAGPEAGSQLAAALLAGGKKAIGQVNTLNAQISTAAQGIGVIGAESQFGMTAKQAAGYANTNVKVEKGAIVVNFGTGVTGQDKADITRAVDTAVTKALDAARREAARK